MNGPFSSIDFDPRKLPKEYLEAIGLVAACSAQTENTIEMAIAGCLGVDGDYGMAITTHMSAPLRDDVLRAAAEIRIDNLDALDELDVILDNINKVVGRRNSTVHNLWGVDEKTGQVITVKITARGSVQAEYIPMSVDGVRADAKAIYDAGMDLLRFLIHYGLVPKLPKLRPRAHKLKAARKKRAKK
jgi:hypothetical protein